MIETLNPARIAKAQQSHDDLMSLIAAIRANQRRQDEISKRYCVGYRPGGLPCRSETTNTPDALCSRCSR